LNENTRAGGCTQLCHLPVAKLLFFVYFGRNSSHKAHTASASSYIFNSNLNFAEATFFDCRYRLTKQII
jgi:hypothetical protein